MGEGARGGGDVITWRESGGVRKGEGVGLGVEKGGDADGHLSSVEVWCMRVENPHEGGV